MRLIIMVKFNSFMKSFMKDDPYPRPTCSMIAYTVLLFGRRNVGRAWFAARDHWILAFLAFLTVVWGLLKAYDVHHADHFSRSGSLVVVLSFYSLFIGSKEYREILHTREDIGSPLDASSRIEVMQKTQGSSNLWVFFIAALGTLIWGYGDTVLNRVFGLRW